MNDLDAALEQIAKVPVLLVASDYDGTIAPIVDDPSQALPHREAIIALRNLAALPQTHVAVISGRALRELAELSTEPEAVHLVGSHGGEFDPDFAQSLTPSEIALRETLFEELTIIAEHFAGSLIEAKPASIAFHYRNVAEAERERAERAALDVGALEGVQTKQGKMVVELGVVPVSKATALQTLRHRAGASAIVFFGDDVTDEDAFRTLTGPDVSVKVGEGESLATFRVEGPVEVARRLAQLREWRDAWLRGAAACAAPRRKTC